MSNRCWLLIDDILNFFITDATRRTVELSAWKLFSDVCNFFFIVNKHELLMMTETVGAGVLILWHQYSCHMTGFSDYFHCSSGQTQSYERWCFYHLLFVAFIDRITLSSDTSPSLRLIVLVFSSFLRFLNDFLDNNICS